MECYAFVSRARFCVFGKNTISTTETANHSTQSNIISGIFTATRRKYHCNFMDLVDLARKIFPNADIYLPTMNCPYSYLKSEGRAICSENQLCVTRAMNRIIEEAIRNASFNVKVLPELPQKIQNSVWNKMKRRIFGGGLRQQAS